MVATTLVKIRTDMPWPIPRCVISSPSHMTTTVPVVIVRTISSTLGIVKSGMKSMLVDVPSKAELSLWKAYANVVDWSTARTMVR
jgi:hypothetical protein